MFILDIDLNDEFVYQYCYCCFVRIRIESETNSLQWKVTSEKELTKLSVCCYYLAKYYYYYCYYYLCLYFWEHQIRPIQLEFFHRSFNNNIKNVSFQASKNLLESYRQSQYLTQITVCKLIKHRSEIAKLIQEKL